MYKVGVPHRCHTYTLYIKPVPQEINVNADFGSELKLWIMVTEEVMLN